MSLRSWEASVAEAELALARALAEPGYAGDMECLFAYHDYARQRLDEARKGLREAQRRARFTVRHWDGECEVVHLLETDDNEVAWVRYGDGVIQSMDHKHFVRSIVAR